MAEAVGGQGDVADGATERLQLLVNEIHVANDMDFLLEDLHAQVAGVLHLGHVRLLVWFVLRPVSIVLFRFDDGLFTLGLHDDADGTISFLCV